MPEQHEASEFGEILNSPEQPLIVGGQAVNIWAEYFAPRNAQVAAQRPFVSKDADISCPSAGAIAHDYFGDLHAEVAEQDLTERALVNALHELHDIITAVGVRELAAQHNFNLASALATDLPTVGMPKLTAFYEHYKGIAS